MRTVLASLLALTSLLGPGCTAPMIAVPDAGTDGDVVLDAARDAASVDAPSTPDAGSLDANALDAAPTCMGCSATEGCCAGACTPLDTVMNCRACGTACPGVGAPMADALCAETGCALTCRGESYDVNGNASDGCEVNDPVPTGHTSATATPHGSASCNDGEMQTISGHIVSDARVHVPAVAGLDTTSGAAPDFWAVAASGGLLCTNDLAATITTTGGSSTACYRLSIVTDRGTYTADVSGSGSAMITQSTNAYTSGSQVRFEIQKTCASVHEDVAYTVQFHL